MPFSLDRRRCATRAMPTHFERRRCAARAMPKRLDRRGCAACAMPPIAMQHTLPQSSKSGRMSFDSGLVRRCCTAIPAHRSGQRIHHALQTSGSRAVQTAAMPYHCTKLRGLRQRAMPQLLHSGLRAQCAMPSGLRQRAMPHHY